MSQGIRVTQLFDCADVGKVFVREGRRQGMPWKIIQGPWTRGGTKAAYYRFRLEQALAYPRTQVWHVNMGGRAKWARGSFARPYTLTLHGTDIRENYWQDQHHAVMKEDVDGAGHVWYTTPDLREKAEQARPDAEYLPAPVDMAELPGWNPAPKPRVFFPSRWDASKGGDALLQTAAEVVSAVGSGGEVDVVGLNWGDRAAEAARLGITLLPRMPKNEFLRELSTAHVAVGQITGVLGLSELQAMAIGVPTVFADHIEGYPADLAVVDVQRSEVGQAVRDALADPRATSARLGGPAYVRNNHGAAALLPRLEAGYAKVLGTAG
ncbi:glycosyltransferase family 4 protein [Arthrobacter sp. ZGTC131]|uniref:glycosyltransferase family 4 protein n=1 Tax=Arthrobacter sp. ZGTC131 TaxID=2058898 RepID=UPI0011B0B1ED|nr:glycosyltransferase family 4 protein [Arthrobacter sp. ZGTC131]